MQISLLAQAATFILTGGGIRWSPASTENPGSVMHGLISHPGASGSQSILICLTLLNT